MTRFAANPDLTSSHYTRVSGTREAVKKPPRFWAGCTNQIHGGHHVSHVHYRRNPGPDP